MLWLLVVVQLPESNPYALRREVEELRIFIVLNLSVKHIDACDEIEKSGKGT